MEMYYLIKTGLLLHIVGITLMAGLTVAAAVAYHRSWKLLSVKPEIAIQILHSTSRYGMLQMIGGISILAGGIAMMTGYRGAPMHQTWFQAKLVLLTLIILNFIFMGRPAMQRLKKVLVAYRSGEMPENAFVVDANRRLRWFSGLQLMLFLCIFVLSSFRF